jgi:hypothetical protein
MPDNLVEMKKTHKQRSLKRLIPSKRTVKWTVLIILVLLVLGYIGLHIWLDIWFEEKIQRYHGNKDIGFAKTFMESTIDFPEEWLHEPDEYYLADKYQDLNESWETFNKENHSFTLKFSKWEELLNSPGGLTQDEWKELGDDLQKAGTFLHVGLKVSREIDNQIAVLKPENRFEIASSNRWISQYYCQIAKVNAAYLIYSNKSEDGVDYLISTLPFAVFNPVLNYKNSNTRKWLLQQIVPQSYSHIKSIKSKKHLRDWLDTLNHLHPFIFPNDYKYAPTYALVSEMNEEKGKGHKLDMAPGKKGAFYMRQIFNRRFPVSGWEGMKKGIDQILQIYLSGQKQFSNDDKIGIVLSLFRFITFSSRLELFCLLHAVKLPNPADIIPDEPRLESQFNELRLTIAGRLYFLENNVYPKSTAQLIPEYLPNDIKDVVTGRSYTWDKNGNLKTIR